MEKWKDTAISNKDPRKNKKKEEMYFKKPCVREGQRLDTGTNIETGRERKRTGNRHTWLLKNVSNSY